MTESRQEVWKTINSKSSLTYEVSNLGQVRRLGSIHPFLKTQTYIYLEGCVRDKGYHVVKLKMGAGYKNVSVHQLVATVFIPNPNNYEVVNHLDGNKLNNCTTNLEWTTLRGNTEHARTTGLLNSKYGSKIGNSVLNEALVAQLREKYIEGNHTFQQLAVEFGVKRGSIVEVIHFKRWKHVPLPLNFDAYMAAVKNAAKRTKSRATSERNRTRVTDVPNGSRIGTAILNEDKVVEIREKYFNGNITKLKLAEEYGVTSAAISDAIYTNTWAHVPVPNGLTRHEYILKITEKEKERQRAAGRQAAENRGRPLTMEQANEIRRRIANGDKQRTLALELNISPSVISSIWKNKTYLT